MASLAESLRRFAQADPSVLKGVRSPNPNINRTEDATASGAFADHLEEQGVPGAHIARSHAERVQNGGPHQGEGIENRRVGPIYVLGEEPKTIDGARDVIGRMNEQGESLPIAMGRQPRRPRSGHYQLQINHSVPGEDALGVGGLTHSADAHSWAELDHLIQDFPRWAQQLIRRDATRQFGARNPRGPRKPPPTDVPQQLARQVTNFLKGGKGDKLKPEDVDPRSLAEGIRVEMEHTKDRRIAQEIALDHLSEDRNYYIKLRKVEKKSRSPGTAFRDAPAEHEGHLDRIANAPESIYPGLQYASWLGANGHEEAADIIGSHIRERQRSKQFGVSGIYDPQEVVTFPAGRFSVKSEPSHYTGETAITLKQAYRNRPGVVTWKARMPSDQAERIVSGLEQKGAKVSRDDRPVVMKRLSTAVRRYAMEHTPEEFHRAIEDNPEDLTNFHAYSDWLEENGKPELAATLRSHLTNGAAIQRIPGAQWFSGKNLQPGEFGINISGIGNATPIWVYHRSLAAPNITYRWVENRPYSGMGDFENRLQQLVNEGAHPTLGARAFLPKPKEESEDMGEDDPNYNRHMARAVKRYAAAPEEAGRFSDAYHRMGIDPESATTTMGVLADEAEEMNSPLAPIYRAIWDQRDQDPQPNAWIHSLYHGGHASKWLLRRPDSYHQDEPDTLIQHMFSPNEDGTVRVSVGGTSHRKSGVHHFTAGRGADVSRQVAEAAIRHLQQMPGMTFHWARGIASQGHREDSPEPVADLRNALETIVGRPLNFDEERPEQLARAIHYAANQIRTQIGGKPYVLTKNEFGYGVTAADSPMDRIARNYQVFCDESGKPVRCSCPDNTYRGGECKHMKAVAELASEQPPTEEQPVQMDAYRAPAGGMIVRGTYYKGGKLIPDMQGSFANPPKSIRQNDGLVREQVRLSCHAAKLERIRSRLKATWKTKAKKVPYVPESDRDEAMVVSYRRAVRQMARTEVDHEPFHSAIMEEPRDSTRSLAYADFLEENDMPQLAAFIREVARTRDDYTQWHRNRTASIMKYTHRPDSEYAAPAVNSVFNYQGLGAYRPSPGRGRRKPPPTTHVAVISPYSEPNGGFLSFYLDVPDSEAHEWTRRLIEEGHPPGNAGRSGRLNAIVQSVAQSKQESDKPSEEPEQLARAVRRMARMSGNLTNLFRAARDNPYDETLHGAIADAIEEEYPGSPFPDLIRKQFETTAPGNEKANNLWYPEFENSWDGTFPYTAHLGSHGPFELYLGHEGEGAQLPHHPGGVNSRWILHAVTRPNRGDFVGYTFEFPHERAHEIPQMAPAAARYISPHTGARKVHNSNREHPEYLPVGPIQHYEEPEWRNHEARLFDEAMDRQERERQ